MSFSAGFAQGFSKTFISNLESRRERIDDLVDKGIASAKAVAPRYMQAQGEYKNVLNIGDTLKNVYGVSDQEFVALAQGTDVTQLYKTIQQENQNRIAAGRGALNKEDFINIVEMPDSVIPEGVTREQAIAQIMGLQGQALAKEDDPKSEGARNRAGGAGIAEFLAFNPKLSAEDQLKAMKIMGYNVSDLEYFQSTSGLKQQVIPGVTRTRDVLFNDIDYDKSTYDNTQRTYNSRFATRLAGADISDVDVFRTTTGIPTDDKQAMRDNAMQGSMAMAQLELGIVNSGLGLGLIGPAARRNLLEGIFSEIDSGRRGVAQLETLMKNINSGKAVDAIAFIFEEKGRFTAEDYQSIISGVSVAEEEKSTEALRPTVKEQTDSALPPVEETPETTEDSEVAALESQIVAEEDPFVKRALQNELNQKLLEDSGEQPEIKYPNARTTAQSNLDNRELMRESMAVVTKEEWKEMSREERREAGLPVRPLDMRFAGDSYFKGNEQQGSEESSSKAALNPTEFIVEFGQDIITDLTEMGITAEDDPEEFKLALADWFGENEGKLGGFSLAGSSVNINMLADVFKITLENLDKK